MKPHVKFLKEFYLSLIINGICFVIIGIHFSEISIYICKTMVDIANWIFNNPEMIIVLIANIPRVYKKIERTEKKYSLDINPSECLTESKMEEYYDEAYKKHPDEKKLRKLAIENAMLWIKALGFVGFKGLKWQELPGEDDNCKISELKEVDINE